MQTDNDTPAICSQIVNGFKQGNVNAPSFLIENPIGLDRICRFMESKLGDLGFQSAYNIANHLPGRKNPYGSQQC